MRSSDGDLEALREELGDLLLQVVFHAQMASEQGAFGFEDVAAGICDKMLRRHPHVFGDARVESAEEQTLAWDEIKAAEKAARGARRACSTTCRWPARPDARRQARQARGAHRLRLARCGGPAPRSTRNSPSSTPCSRPAPRRVAGGGDRRPAVLGRQPGAAPRGRPGGGPARQQCALRAPLPPCGAPPGRVGPGSGVRRPRAPGAWWQEAKQGRGRLSRARATCSGRVHAAFHYNRNHDHPSRRRPDRCAAAGVAPGLAGCRVPARAPRHRRPHDRAPMRR
jgi:hypothetical protein